MPIVEMPDGAQVQFPDDMPKDQIRDMIASKFPELANAPQAQSNAYKGGILDAGANALQSGFMAQFDDELAGAMLSPIEATKDWFQGKGFDLKRGYNRIQQAEQARKEERRAKHPIVSGVGEITGGIAQAGGIAKNIGTLVGKGLVPAMAEGALYGGVHSAGEAKHGEKIKEGLKGAVIGGATVGVLDKVGKAGGKIFNRLMGKKAPLVQSAQQLKDQAAMLYKQADDVGVQIKGKALKSAVTNMKMAAGKRTTARERLFQETFDVVDFLEESAKAGKLSLSDVDDIRQVIGDTIGDASRRNKKPLIRIKGFLDDFMENLTPSQVTGDVKTANETIKQARETYSRFAKSEMIEEAFHKALNQATGFENGLVVQFRQLSNNPKKFAKFSKAEQEAINKVVRGDHIGNALRAFAWFSPQKTLGAVMTGLTAAEGGLGPAALVSSTGMLATKAAEKARMGNVETLQRIVQGIELPKQVTGPIAAMTGRIGAQQVPQQILQPNN